MFSFQFGILWGVHGMFMECSWDVQPVLGAFAVLETMFLSL